MVSIDYTDGPGLARRAGASRTARIELDPSAIVLHYAQEVFEGLKAYRWADGAIVSFRPEANAARLRTSAHRLAIPELPEELFIESLRQLIAVDGDWVPACRRRGVAVPAAVHLRHRARPRRAPGQRVPLPGDRLAGRRLLPGRHQAGQRVAVHRVRAGQPGRHRRGQVRRQLRGLAAGAGRGRRAGLRPGGLAGRHRTPLRRGDGRHEPVLRVRQRWHRPGWSPRSCPARCCPASPGTRCCSWQPTRASRSRSARSTSTSGRRRPPPARSPRCSRAAPPPSSPRCRTVKYGDGEFTIADGEPGEVTMALRDTLTGIQRGTFADTHGWMTRLG